MVTWLRTRLAARLARLRTDRSGMAAVEFALILPLMLTLYFGCVEVGDIVIINRKVTHVTSTLADLVTQSRSLTNADMTNILNAASSVVTPYPASLVTIVVTGITIDANSKATVAWSDAKNATALTKGATVTVPAGVKVASSFVVTTTVTYKYTPVIGYMLTGPVTLHDQFYLKPRLSDTITRTAT